MYLNLLFLSLITVFIIDYSGIIQEVEEVLQKWLKMPNKAHIPKPFSCSLCMTWWTGLIYLIIAGQFTFMAVAYVALLSAFTPVFHSLIVFSVSLFKRGIMLLEDRLGL